MKAACVVLLAVAAAPAVWAQAPIAHEDLWLMRRVDSPVPSPDGKWVAVSVVEPAYESNDQVNDIWLVPADASQPPRRITSSKAAESGISWSSDSTRIAFSAKRDGDEEAQIYVLDLNRGGEAQKVTGLASGASAPDWSPDGSMLLFQSTLIRGAADQAAHKKMAEERKARKYRARVFETFPIRYWDKWLEEEERRLYVQAPVLGSQPRDLLAGTQLVLQPGYGAGSSQNLQPAWAPDGQSVVFAATTVRTQAAYAHVRFDLYQVRVRGGEPTQLTTGKNYTYSRPKFRPDGKALYVIAEKLGSNSYYHDRLAMMPWPNVDAPRLLTEEFDRSVASFAFTPDSRTIYLTAEDAGQEKLYTMPAQGGTVSLAAAPKTGCYSNLSLAESAPQPVLVANYDSATSPPEVVRIDPASKSHRPLTTFNGERTAKLDLPDLRQFRFTNPRGQSIHSMLALPPGFDESKKYPLLVLMHGGPHSQWRDQWVMRWNYHLLAQPGYVVLLTNYVGSTGYGEKFGQAINGDPLRGPADDINQAADEAVKRFPFIDGSRMAAAGASYGGHLANWMQATTTRYKCLISHAGLIDLESQYATSDVIFHRELGMGGPPWAGGKLWQEQNPIRYAGQFKTPMLITHGELDYRVPLNHAIENWSILQRMKVPGRLIVFPEENHWILKGENSKFFYSEVHRWLAEHLKPATGQRASR
jgi:dipeptidyl aminopeptidase/acylaminoacyl peptidase